MSVESLGLTKGALYYFFPTKESLAVESSSATSKPGSRSSAKWSRRNDNELDALAASTFHVAVHVRLRRAGRGQDPVVGGAQPDRGGATETLRRLGRHRHRHPRHGAEQRNRGLWRGPTPERSPPPVLGRLGDGAHLRSVTIWSAALSLPAVCSLLCRRASPSCWPAGPECVGVALVPLAIAIARDDLPPQRSRRIIVALGITTTTGVGLGYPLAGALTEYLGLGAGAGLSLVGFDAAALVLPPSPRSATAGSICSVLASWRSGSSPCSSPSPRARPGVGVLPGWRLSPLSPSSPWPAGSGGSCGRRGPWCRCGCCPGVR